MIIKIFTGPFNYDIYKLYEKEENEFLIGVDKGAYTLLIEGITPDLSIGDFDSVSKKEYELIKMESKEVITLKQMKDETDTYIAIKKAIEMDAEKIIVYGGIGNRVDHSIANINLLTLGNIVMMNEYSKMFCLDPGSYSIINEYKYISFFAQEDIKKLNLKGFKYEVLDYNLQTGDNLCISNQGSGEISFKEGLLLVIQQNE